MGEENFLKEEAINSIRNTLFPDTISANVNTEIYSASEIDIDTIIQKARDLPLWAGKRLIIVKNLERIPRTAWHKFSGYLAHPNPSTYLIFMSEGADRKASFPEEFKKNGIIIEFKPLSKAKMIQWIKNRAKITGFGITDEAIELLIELIGEDLYALSNEMEKASLLLDKGHKIIGREEIIRVAGDHRVRSIFELISAIEKGRLEDSINVLNKLIEYGESPLGILGIIARHYRILIEVKSMLKKGLSKSEIARRIKRSIYNVEPLITHAKAISNNRLEEILKKILDTDWKIKSDFHSPRLALEMLIIELIGESIAQ